MGQVLREHPDVDISEDPGEVSAGLDLIEASERSRLVVEAAQELYLDLVRDPSVDEGSMLIKTQDVLNLLRRRGLDLGVQQPLAVIGTVLSNAHGFRRIARNTFEYQVESVPAYMDIDDLPF